MDSDVKAAESIPDCRVCSAFQNYSVDKAGRRGRAAEKVICARHLESQYVAHKQYLGGFFAETAKGGICLIIKNVACKNARTRR